MRCRPRWRWARRRPVRRSAGAHARSRTRQSNNASNDPWPTCSSSRAGNEARQVVVGERGPSDGVQNVVRLSDDLLAVAPGDLPVIKGGHGPR